MAEGGASRVTEAPVLSSTVTGKAEASAALAGGACWQESTGVDSASPQAAANSRTAASRTSRLRSFMTNTSRWLSEGREGAGKQITPARVAGVSRSGTEPMPFLEGWYADRGRRPGYPGIPTRRDPGIQLRG